MTTEEMREIRRLLQHHINVVELEDNIIFKVEEIIEKRIEKHDRKRYTIFKK